VVVAIRIDKISIATSENRTTSTKEIDGTEAEQAGWFNGPPYAVAEIVFDEDDLEGCSLTQDAS